MSPSKVPVTAEMSSPTTRLLSQVSVRAEHLYGHTECGFWKGFEHFLNESKTVLELTLIAASCCSPAPSGPPLFISTPLWTTLGTSKSAFPLLGSKFVHKQNLSWWWLTFFFHSLQSAPSDRLTKQLLSLLNLEHRHDLERVAQHRIYFFLFDKSMSISISSSRGEKAFTDELKVQDLYAGNPVPEIK